MRKFWENYSLSIVLFVLFAVAWAVQTGAGWQLFKAQELQHGAVPQVFGAEGYVWDWLQATFENWQSEFLQLFAMVVLTSFLIHKGSAESRDSQDEMMARSKDIQAELDDVRSQLSDNKK